MSDNQTGPTAPDQGRWTPTGTPGGTPTGTPGGAPAGRGAGGDPTVLGFEPAEASPQRTAPRAKSRRPPVWVLVVGPLLAVGGIVAAALALGGGDPEPAPEAEVVTLPVPTPTVAPVERAPGTAFADALPSTVLRYALASTAEDVALLQAGAVEGYVLGYTDGAAQITAHAGQWPTAESAVAAYQARVAALAAATPGTAVEEGPVEVAGTEVGRWTLVPDAAGAASLVWTNGTAVLQLDGPLEDVRDVFTGFSL